MDGATLVARAGLAQPGIVNVTTSSKQGIESRYYVFPPAYVIQFWYIGDLSDLFETGLRNDFGRPLQSKVDLSPSAHIIMHASCGEPTFYLHRMFDSVTYRTAQPFGCAQRRT